MERKLEKHINTWRLKNTLLKNQWVNKEIKEEIRKYLEWNENRNITFQHLWGAEETVVRGNFIPIQAYLKKQEKFQINNLTLYLKDLEREEQSPKLIEGRNNKDQSRNKWNRKKKEKINETKTWFFEKIKKNWDFPGGTVVKNPHANAGDMGSSPGPGRSHMPWSS